MNLNIESKLVQIGMDKYGGSFAKSLGIALSNADANNTTIIKNAFPEIWERYLDMGKYVEEST